MSSTNQKNIDTLLHVPTDTPVRAPTVTRVTTPPPASPPSTAVPVIESHITLPPPRRGPGAIPGAHNKTLSSALAFPFLSLRPGESFFASDEYIVSHTKKLATTRKGRPISTNASPQALVGRMCRSAEAFAKKRGVTVRFATRVLVEGGVTGVRVWCVTREASAE